MATPSEQLPFRVQFIQGNGSRRERLVVPEFCTARELGEQDGAMVNLTENLALKLQFSSEDQTARLYMDGFESLPQERLAEGADGRPFLPPGQLNLFTHETYSWIPGLYRLEVDQGGERYFALVQVLPKEMTLAEWTAMKDELEGELRGLALDLTSQQLGLGMRYRDVVSPQLLRQFLVVRRLFPRVMLALFDLEKNVNHRVRKVPVALPQDQVNGHRLPLLPRKATAKRQLVLVPQVDYDLPENRFVLQITELAILQLQRFLVAVRSLLTQIASKQALEAEYSFQASTDQQLREYQSVRSVVKGFLSAAEKMQLGLQLLHRAPWAEQVGQGAPVRLPQALQRDGRYRALYDLYLELQVADWQPRLDQSFHYQWKRTDRLYEIWCVIQVCRAFASLQFVPVSGWLYDQDWSREESLVPDLPAGTVLTFLRGDVTLRLSYDQELPRQSDDTALPERPVYTQDVHQRPDLRLDFYQGQLFVGCLIIECKYRPLRGFWKTETLASGYDRPKAMSQLISYGMAIRSPYLYGLRPDWAEHRSQVVLEVWALHPGAKSEPPEQYSADHRLRIFCLRPGITADLLADRLAGCLTRL